MLLTFVVTLVLSLTTNWLVRFVAHQNGWLSKPRSARHIHVHPVPRLGGIGVFTSFVMVASVTAILKPYWLPQSGFLKLLIPATVMFAVGLWDDLRPVPPKIKLLFQIACGGALFLWMRHTHVGQAIGSTEFGSAILLVGVVGWVVLVSNSINLIDGVDGLAGGTAVLSLVAIACVASYAGQVQIAFLATILIASTLGFLRFNLNPATIFLGDSGSLFLGFMISALSIAWSGSHSLRISVAVAVAILALPLAEIAVSVSRRFLSRRPLFTSDREHMHHKLLERGLSQRHVAYLLCAVVATSGLAGIAIALGGPKTFVVSVSTLMIIVVVGVLTLEYSEFVEIGRIIRRVGEQRRIVANDVVLRKIARRISKTVCLGSLGDELRIAFSTMQFDGVELSLTPWFIAAVPCETRSAVTKWGTSVKTRSIDSTCWTMGIDLLSDQYGSLGWIGFTRAMDKGPLLFDANVIVTTLQPAIIAALERCLVQCRQHQASVKNRTSAWTPVPNQLSTRTTEVSDKGHTVSQ